MLCLAFSPSSPWRRTFSTKNPLRESFTRPVCTVVRCQERLKSGGSRGRWVYLNRRLLTGARWVYLSDNETPARRGACDRHELHPLGRRHQWPPAVPTIGTADDRARPGGAVTSEDIAMRGARTDDVVQRVDATGDRPRGPRWLSSRAGSGDPIRSQWRSSAGFRGRAHMSRSVAHLTGRKKQPIPVRDR